MCTCHHLKFIHTSLIFCDILQTAIPTGEVFRHRWHRWDLNLHICVDISIWTGQTVVLPGAHLVVSTVVLPGVHLVVSTVVLPGVHLVVSTERLSHAP